MYGPASPAIDSCDPSAEVSSTAAAEMEPAAATCSAASIGGAYASSSAAARTIPALTIGSDASSRQWRRSSRTSNSREASNRGRKRSACL